MRASRLASRLALIPAGALLGLLLLEGLLQLGALAVRASGWTPPAAWLTGNRRVLCLGDSNTYGLYLSDRAQAYPQTFETLWNATAGAPRIEVLNLGYPGTNSSRLRRDLPRMLETFAPDVAIIMVGSNDYWTAAVDVAPPPGVVSRFVQGVKRGSRLYQLAYMLRRALSSDQLEVAYDPRANGGAVGTARYGDAEFSMGYERAPREPAQYREHLDANLRALVDEVRRFGATPVLMTYASRQWNYGEASHVIRRVARATGTRLVDAAEALAVACPKEPCPAYLYGDHHPTARGYHLMAEALVRELKGSL
ncbi:MAG TPA: SGNH/GDSL hydrolase family protein [Candidatus Dormibacteraeota bacterium]|nr:SGNH/GDSL hydrolase family protein [Candidatus Dormibacteraeota bacterium]